MTELDFYRDRKAELRAVGMSATAAHGIAYGEAMRILHDREQEWHDAQEDAL